MPSQKLEANVDGQRVDVFLTLSCPDLSRSRIQSLVLNGYVKVNGKSVKSSTRLNFGEFVTLVIPPPIEPTLRAQPIDIDIVYEDASIIVVNKPSGLTTHPGPGHPDGTLVNAVLDLVSDFKAIGGEIRPGIVHRLDKDTSGLMVIAKDEMSHSKLSAQFKDRTVTKKYLSLVDGIPVPARAVIEGPIARHPTSRKKMAIVTTGRHAKTFYQTIKKIDQYALLEVIPETGRTHQIRVHLASSGYPVVGDSVYGTSVKGFNRHFLHACYLSFDHPVKNRKLEFCSQLPNDLESFVDSIDS